MSFLFFSFGFVNHKYLTEHTWDVTKSLTIRSTSGNPRDTIVLAEDPYDHVFNVTADYVKINGFTVEEATGWGCAGIYLEADYCNISNNNCSNNKHGIHLEYDSNNNHIYLNNFINNTYNVYSYESTNTWNSTEKITYTPTVEELIQAVLVTTGAITQEQIETEMESVIPFIR